MLSNGFSTRDLAVFFRELKSMASFGYFDESDTHEGTYWTVVGGALARPQAWVDIDEPWKDALGKFGVSAFRATDFAHSRGEFKGWDKEEDKRRDFLASLFGAMKGKFIIPTFTCLYNDEFYKVKKSFPEQGRSRYDLCCEILLGQLGRYATEHPDFDPIAVILHAGQPIKSEYLRSFLDGEEMERRRNQFRIESVDTMCKAVPLEVADWIAYEVRNELYRISTHAARAMRFPLKQLAEQHGWPHGNIIDGAMAREVFEAERKMRQISPHKFRKPQK